jgi:hypothetical protein
MAFLDRNTKAAYNSTYLQVAVQWLNQAFCFSSSSVLVDSFGSEIATFGQQQSLKIVPK